MCDDLNVDVDESCESVENEFENLDASLEDITETYSDDEIFDDFFSDDLEEKVEDIDIDNMSLDELRELRDTLTEETSDVETEMPDITAEENDYSYHWDGGPTHNTEWDDVGDEIPNVKEKVLKR